MEDCNNTPNQGTKVPFDPGWNDPPKFSYNAQQTTPSRPRNFLNKRVAFPLSSNVSSPQPPTLANLPHIPLAVATPSLQPIPKNDKLEESLTLDNQAILNEVKVILLEFLDNNSELGSKANDIRRRISVMEDMWLNGKLNNIIYIEMQKLAYALRDNLPTEADNIHRALMVDHISAVGTWMPGVKQLIHHCIARSELLAIDKEAD